MRRTKVTGLMLATAAAGLFATVPALSADNKEEAKVMCVGGNACKGQSACMTAGNACKGQNACKGKGVVEMNKKDCEVAKGKAAAKDDKKG